ncbi:SMI1/KNR4 family protein [Roseateles sp. DXS20W]|uniref:SMI1/KNR4 family protein n=1 Tax=Pelomonas lactea TaxID=3299030 RepID=A0ABW7GG40_9BURK
MAATICKGNGPLADAEVQSAEQALGVSFPPDYREFLLRVNGGFPDPRGFNVDWAPEQVCGQHWRRTSMSWFYEISDSDVCNLVTTNRVDFVGRLPTGTLAIASDAGGNQLLLALCGPHVGKLLLWIKGHEASDDEAPGYDNVGVVADSFADFVERRLTETP